MRSSLSVRLRMLLAAVVGCQANATKVAPAEPPVVPVSQPLQREVTDYVDFTGRTEAVYSVDIRPRVTGYLVEMPFEEGAEVKAGDLLFVVDPRPYKAQLDQAQGQVDLYKASLKLAKTTLARDRAINVLSPGSVSQQQFDQEQAVVDEADARVKAFEKSMEISKLSYEFTRVISPIDGQISRYYLTLGNLVNQDQTLLTTVVSVDPMYVYFEMDEPTLLRFRQGGQRGQDQDARQGHRISCLHGACRGRTGFLTRGRSTLSTTRSIPPRAVSWCAVCFPTPCPRWAAGSCRRACSCESGCRSANPIRPCWFSIAPSVRTRGSSTSTCSTRKTRPSIAGSRPAHRMRPTARHRARAPSRMIGCSSADCSKSARA